MIIKDLPNLLPCPFCKGIPVIDHAAYGYNGFGGGIDYWTFNIKCEKCNLNFGEIDIKDKLFNDLSEYKLKLKLINKWNKHLKINGRK
jgi:hypothetical protein